MRFATRLSVLVTLGLCAVGHAENKYVRGLVSPLPIKLDSSFKIGKVNEYLHKQKVGDLGNDRSIQFDRKYYLYGSVTSKQRNEKWGQYFTFHWHSAEKANLIARLEYRQEKTRDEVFRLEVPYEGAQGSQVSEFQIVGDAFRDQGLVNSWRMTIIKDGWIVAEKKSMAW